MKCVVCGESNWSTIFEYDQPDKYEKWVGLTDIQRKWQLCDCGMYQQSRNYPLPFLEKIYEDGYRSKKFRGETIKQAFDRINAIPNNENDKRIKWMLKHMPHFESVLDIGSGIGVFPAALKKMGCTIWTTEMNHESKRFINYLGIPCASEIPKYAKFDVVSMIHLLEHFEDPYPILEDVKSVLKSTGKLFIEVPCASEFETLAQDNDEFNSCHCLFLSTSSLARVMEKSGYTVVKMGELHYPGRDLKRLVAACQKTPK